MDRMRVFIMVGVGIAIAAPLMLSWIAYATEACITVDGQTNCRQDYGFVAFMHAILFVVFYFISIDSCVFRGPLVSSPYALIDV